MRCPYCRGKTKTTNSRFIKKKEIRRRVLICSVCEWRGASYERVEKAPSRYTDWRTDQAIGQSGERREG